MRKRIQFMYGGKLEKIKFSYTGPNIEAVLDRLPTARVLGERVVDPNTGEIINSEQSNKGQPKPNREHSATDKQTPNDATTHAQKETIVEAEVFRGNGLDMWLKSQGDWLKIEN